MPPGPSAHPACAPSAGRLTAGAEAGGSAAGPLPVPVHAAAVRSAAAASAAGAGRRDRRLGAASVPGRSGMAGMVRTHAPAALTAHVDPT